LLQGLRYYFRKVGEAMDNPDPDNVSVWENPQNVAVFLFSLSAVIFFGTLIFITMA